MFARGEDGVADVAFHDHEAFTTFLRAVDSRLSSGQPCGHYLKRKTCTATSQKNRKPSRTAADSNGTVRPQIQLKRGGSMRFKHKQVLTCTDQLLWQHSGQMTAVV